MSNSSNIHVLLQLKNEPGLSACFLHCFTAQLTQWRQFEEDQNNPSQMAKYFSSPSKSQPSVYSQDEIYYLLGENSSMKKLINEVM